MFLSGLAAIVISIVMLRGRVFSRINAWARIAGFSFLTLGFEAAGLKRRSEERVGSHP